MFRDGDDVHLQSRNGKPMNRYFPDVVEQALALPAQRYVIDGEMVVTVDGIQEFDLLSQRIHPAASRVERLAKETPATLVAFDLLAEGDETLLELPYTERRERLAELVADPVELTPSTDDAEAAGQWLAGTGEGVIAKQASAPYSPGERVGMVKVKRVRTADAVVAAFRFGKEPDTVGSLILGMYDDDDGELRIVGPHVGLPRQAEARAARSCSSPIAPASAARASRAAGSRTRSWSGRACARSWSARSRSTTSPAAGSVTGQSSCAGGPIRSRRNASLLNCATDRSRCSCSPARWRRLRRRSTRSRPTTRSWATRARAARSTCTGMRNPYRWSFDRLTGDMWIGDVGGSNPDQEEITRLPAGSIAGANLGWNCFSGTVVQDGLHARQPPPAASTSTRAAPDVVIGGYVVRDPDLGAFAGVYLFGEAQQRHLPARRRDGHEHRTGRAARCPASARTASGTCT